MEPTIGLVTVSRNGKGLRRLLDWASPYFDTIYVYADKTSPDKTERIAKQYMLKSSNNFVVEPIDVGGVIENVIQYAYDQAETDWILRLDDDELMGERFENNYRQMMKLPYDIFLCPRYNLCSPNTYINDPDRYRDYQTRWFRKGYVKHKGDVHEGPVGRGISTATDCHIFHFSMLDYSKEERAAKYEIYNTDNRSTNLALSYGGPPDFYRRFSVWEDYPYEELPVEEKCVTMKVAV